MSKMISGVILDAVSLVSGQKVSANPSVKNATRAAEATAMPPDILAAV
jgi:hypothetical protein